MGSTLALVTRLYTTSVAAMPIARTTMKTTTSISDIPRPRRLMHIAGFRFDGDRMSGHVQRLRAARLSERVEPERGSRQGHIAGGRQSVGRGRARLHESGGTASVVRERYRP